MKKKKKTRILLLSGTLLLILIIILTLFITNRNKQDTDTNKPKIVDKIDNYNYEIDENATPYYKSLYKELKKELNKTEVNEEEYAKLVSKLFVTDLFTLSNKTSKNNVGGVPFIYKDFKEDFIKIAKDTIYSNVTNNIYNDKDRNLPTVTKVEITSFNESTFTYKEEKLPSYEVTLTLEYEKDLGYPKEYHLVLIKQDKYIEVAKAY